MFSEEHVYSIALRRCNLVGDINFQKLVSAAGSAKKAWDFPKKDFSKIFGIGTRIVHDLGNSEHLKFAENEINFCEKNNISILLRHLKELPILLSECEDAPALLYSKGKWDNQKESISIVGTRNITPYGKHFIEELLEKLPSKKIITTSGLAIGADTEVHTQSLVNNIPTCAVLAHGFHTLYPSKNKKLSEKILEENGCLFTEFNSSQKPDRENFIQRNRIIAGLSKATIVVETAFGGGSVSTISFANGYNRDVYALPGKITDKYSQGCNQLIFQNKAMTISTIKDLLKELGLEKKKIQMDELFPTSEKIVSLTDPQENLYKLILNNQPISIDEISEKLELPSFKILPILLELELLSLIKQTSGRQFSVNK